jgi:transcriptional regulator with XRE-family HTH domain
LAPRETLDIPTRRRIATKLRELQRTHKFASASEMARVLGISRGAMTRYLNGERTVGLDVVLRVHRRLHVSVDWLVDRN